MKLSREDKNHTMMGKKNKSNGKKKNKSNGKKKTNRMGKKKQIEQVFSLLFFQLSGFRQHPL